MTRLGGYIEAMLIIIPILILAAILTNAVVHIVPDGLGKTILEVGFSAFGIVLLIIVLLRHDKL